CCLQVKNKSSYRLPCLIVSASSLPLLFPKILTSRRKLPDRGFRVQGLWRIKTPVIRNKEERNCSSRLKTLAVECFGGGKAYEGMLVASLSVNAPLYSARPTITPSTPSLASGSSRRISPNVATPPEAMTGIPTERATLAVSSTFTPACVPSRPISV